MTTFPALIPSGRTFTPGVYPHSTFVGKSGRSSRVRNSNVMLGSQLRLSFSAITEAQMLSILSHYQGRSGTFQSFPLSAAVWNAVSDATDYQLAGYGWRYVEPPSVTDAMCANAYDVELTLETVPPEGTALPGLNSVGIQSIITTAITGGAASGESSSAAGANLTATASIDHEGGSVAGLAETATVTLAAGTVTSGAGPSPLNALVGWTLAPGIAFVPGSEDLSFNVNWSLAGGSASASQPTYRYYRLTNFANTDLSGDTIDFGEIEVFDQNIKHAGITCTANFNFSFGDASRLVDGATYAGSGTRAFRSGWSGIRSTATISLDLGSSKPITHVKIYTLFSPPRFPAFFDLQGSSNGSEYTTISTVTVGTNFASLGGDSYSSEKVAV